MSLRPRGNHLRCSEIGGDDIATELIERLDEFPDDQVLEAVNLLAFEALGPTPDADVLQDVADTLDEDVHTVQAALRQASPSETAALARVVLIAYARERSEDEVVSALEATGEKAFLLETLVIGTLALGIGHLVLTRGKKQQRRETTIEVQPDGKISVKSMEQTHYYSVGESLARVLEGLLAKLGG